jgi:hypothetical protein
MPNIDFLIHSHIIFKILLIFIILTIAVKTLLIIIVLTIELKPIIIANNIPNNYSIFYNKQKKYKPLLIISYIISIFSYTSDEAYCIGEKEIIHMWRVMPAAIGSWGHYRCVSLTCERAEKVNSKPCITDCIENQKAYPNPDKICKLQDWGFFTGQTQKSNTYAHNSGRTMIELPEPITSNYSKKQNFNMKGEPEDVPINELNLSKHLSEVNQTAINDKALPMIKNNRKNKYFETPKDDGF